MRALFTIAAALLLAACGGKVVYEGGAGGAGGASSSSSILTGPPPPPDGSSSVVTTGDFVSSSSVVVSSSSTGPDMCAGQPADQCAQCCVNFFSEEYTVFVGDVINACACANPMQQCAGPCGPGCKDPSLADQTCFDCLNNILSAGDPCGEQAQNACFNQPGCGPVLSCILNCQ